jgi:hypothetical protein
VPTVWVPGGDRGVDTHFGLLADTRISRVGVDPITPRDGRALRLLLMLPAIGKELTAVRD